MIHIAILKKSWGLLPKILAGEKTVESRWYKNRVAPWDCIRAGETVYFKNGGEPVSVRAEVDKVLRFADLNPRGIKRIIGQYGNKLGIGEDKLEQFYQMFKNKRYCILVFLKNPQKIKPFNINKKGFGLMSAWLTTDNLAKIRT